MDWRVHKAARLARTFFGELAHAVRLVTRHRRARAETDLNGFVNLYSEIFYDRAGLFSYGNCLSAAEIVERLPLSSLPIPIRASVSDTADDHMELVFAHAMESRESGSLCPHPAEARCYGRSSKRPTQ